MKKFLLIPIIFLIILTGCTNENQERKEVNTVSRVVIGSEDISSQYTDSHIIKLNGNSGTYDGEEIKEYNYTLNYDSTSVHNDVKNSPAIYYTGDKPSEDDSIYIAHDIIYYPELDADKFTLVNYDGEMEYVYYYEDGENNEYIFSTLPSIYNEVPTQMMHSKQEAYDNPVLHIKQAGTYILEGNFKGQVNISFDDENSFTNIEDKVTIILNGVDIECSVAPAIFFENLYECDNTWEEKEEHSSVVDTSEAGANVIIADQSVNNIIGSNIYRILKTKYKDEESTSAIKTQKKQYKYDGAFYSCVSMNIYGDTGILNITSTTYEGLDTELHLTINGGYIYIYSQDDGVNVNEDDVSVVTINGGNINIFAGLGAEGDGIDSNGYVTINGGTLIAVANPVSDNGVDAAKEISVNGGNVVALGSTMFQNSYSIYIDGQAQYNSQFIEGLSNFGKIGGPGNNNFNPNNIPEKFNENFDFENMPNDFGPDNMPQRVNSQN